MNCPPDMGHHGRCSLCGEELHIEVAEWHRELGHCASCGANARFRGVILALAEEIYGDMVVPLTEAPARKDIRVLGISDSTVYASLLADRFCYLNTHFHQDPRLDICDRNACLGHPENDIVICSDIIEHTLCGPFSVIRNLLAMLRPGGSLILTAPSFDMDDSIEWYGALADYSVEEYDGSRVLRWKNLRGEEFLDRFPIFHGGPGAVVELRLLSHRHLLAIGEQLGCVAQTIDFRPDWGYSWPLVPQFSYLEAPVDGRVIVYRAARSG
jgi:hypothetical protein